MLIGMPTAALHTPHSIQQGQITDMPTDTVVLVFACALPDWEHNKQRVWIAILKTRPHRAHVNAKTTQNLLSHHNSEYVSFRSRMLGAPGLREAGQLACWNPVT